jgi:predicted ABC-type ATPase
VAKHASQVARIAVLAGVNGAGKSSIGGAMIRESGGDYWNPDEVARKIRENSPKLSVTEANGLAWREGVKRLDDAIRRGTAFSFETTLGGASIVARLERAAQVGAEVRVWYVGLASVELHVSRIAARVAAGGHDIDERDVRRRYRSSRVNLIRLIPHLAELKVFDNSVDANPRDGLFPKPMLVLHAKKGLIVDPDDLRPTPDWAKPIVAAALKHGSPLR